MSTVSDGTSTLTPELVLGYETRQPGRNIFHDVIGREDPDVTLRRAGLRTGTLKLFFLTEGQANACRLLHSRPAVFTYTASDNATTSMRYAVDDSGITVTLDDDTRRRWVVAVAYREVLG